MRRFAAAGAVMADRPDPQSERTGAFSTDQFNNTDRVAAC